MADYGWAPILISGLSLGVAATSALRNTWMRGTLKMTRPTLIVLIDSGEKPKVVIQSFIYATAPRGLVVQNMYVVLSRPQLSQTFGVWGFAPDGRLVEFGNGRHVGSEGIAVMHHFLLPPDGTTHAFLPGKYRLEVFASLAHKKDDIKLYKHEFQLDESHVLALEQGGPGVTFMMDPKEREYRPHVREPLILPDGAQKESPMTIDAALLVELIATDGAPVIFRDDFVDINLALRLLNKGNVVVTPEALHIDWRVWGDKFAREGSTQVKEEFRALGIGQHQSIQVPVQLRAFDGNVPTLVRVQISGRVVARAAEWGGSKSEHHGSIMWGKAIDQRPPRKPSAP